MAKQIEVSMEPCFFKPKMFLDFQTGIFDSPTHFGVGNSIRIVLDFVYGCDEMFSTMLHVLVLCMY